MDTAILKSIDWLRALARRAFRDEHFDYDMEVEKCGMTA